MARRQGGALTAVGARLGGSDGASVAAFLVPGLALWLPSGYSWGATWLLMCALVGVRCWWRRPLDRSSWRLLLVIAGIGLLWSIDTGPQPGLGSAEMLLKYLLALPCLCFAVAAPPRPNALWGGLAIGGVGSGVLALIQFFGLDHERASGLVNAIQYGDLSLLIGLMAWAALSARWSHLGTGQRAWLAAGSAFGIIGSLLSLTRGGWLTLALIAPILGVLLVRRGLATQAAKATLVVTAAVALVWPFVHSTLGARVSLASEEVAAYTDQDVTNTSVGLRLELWNAALHMGMQRPLLGWGSAYKAGQQQAVREGDADPLILTLDHAHNEFLDMFARCGLVGVALLLLYLLVPLWLFWPPAAIPGDARAATRLALSLVGILLPLGYLGFGLTQVFFSHNSGHLFYLFMLILVHATRVGIDAQRAR